MEGSDRVGYKVGYNPTTETACFILTRVDSMSMLPPYPMILYHMPVVL